MRRRRSHRLRLLRSLQRIDATFRPRCPLCGPCSRRLRSCRRRLRARCVGVAPRERSCRSGLGRGGSSREPLLPRLRLGVRLRLGDRRAVDELRCRQLPCLCLCSVGLSCQEERAAVGLHARHGRGTGTRRLPTRARRRLLLLQRRASRGCHCGSDHADCAASRRFGQSLRSHLLPKAGQEHPRHRRRSPASHGRRFTHEVAARVKMCAHNLGGRTAGTGRLPVDDTDEELRIVAIFVEVRRGVVHVGRRAKHIVVGSTRGCTP